MKRIWIFLAVWSVSLMVLAQPQTRVLLEPFDIDYGEQTDYFLEGIDQIETNGDALFLRSEKLPAVVVTDLNGKLKYVLGNQGQGPGEFAGGGVLAISVHDNRVWALDINANHARHFEGDTFVDQFSIPSYSTPNFGPSTHAFGVSDFEVVLPTAPETGHLAAAYDFVGNEQRKIGTVMTFDERIADLTKGINHTLWRFHDDHWFAFHIYFPIVTKFDRNFKQVQQFRYESKVTKFMVNNLAGFEPERPGQVPPPTINDVKFHGDHLYVLSSGALHQIDAKTGDVLNLAFFHGEGENFAKVGGRNVILFSFTIVPDGRVLLAHPMYLWGYPMWRADVPFVKAQPAGAQGH